MTGGVEVLKPGLETCVQDYPGRKGAFGMGFPPSGPIDHWSFRLANILVGNEPGAAALPALWLGPPAAGSIEPALTDVRRFRRGIWPNGGRGAQGATHGGESRRASGI